MKELIPGFLFAVLVAANAAADGADALSREELDGWLAAYGKAWETRDANAAAALFTAEATYQDVPFDPPHQGQEGIRNYWSGVTKDQRNVKFGYEVIAVSGSTGIAHWTAEFDVEPSKAHLSLNGVFVLEFDADGRCRSLREWWHLKSAEPAAAPQ
jgi:ketosteroid isomerase-like protein